MTALVGDIDVSGLGLGCASDESAGRLSAP